MFYILKFKFFWNLKYYFLKKFFKFFIFYFFDSLKNYFWININFLKKNFLLKNNKKIFFLFFNIFSNFCFFSIFNIITSTYFKKYVFFITGYLNLYQINYINFFNNFYFIINKNVCLKKNNIYV
ncbi:hypothetical protein [Candidatus Nasuia deltocephalinicola]|uniref:hypothetical protein n=1 Tax=Candidatus Nasuia deltocephalincola TaxID=1160784 RepID=UPI00216B58C2|nr:hypothetical protein [Candidatus Nasuia deltocephalinicola]